VRIVRLSGAGPDTDAERSVGKADDSFCDGSVVAPVFGVEPTTGNQAIDADPGHLDVEKQGALAQSIAIAARPLRR
jgi:hypothetical protein